ncbi:MAG: POTRA domain-containing protein, partial [Ignavibacteriaceae bacterium]
MKSVLKSETPDGKRQTSNSTLSFQLRHMKVKLIAFYNKNGYRDARLMSDSVVPGAENRLKVYLNIEEGDKYYFGNITWIGNTVYPSGILSAALGIKKGDIYNQEL